MPGGSGRAAFVEDAADGSGTDDKPDDEGQDQYDLEDAFIDNSEDVSDEEGMHAAFQHLQLGLAPPDVTTKRRRTEPLSPDPPARVSVRTKRPNPKFLFSQQQRVNTGAVQPVCVCMCVCVCVCVCVLLSVCVCVCLFCFSQSERCCSQTATAIWGPTCARAKSVCRSSDKT